MYTGLNPADIIQLKPMDFKEYKHELETGETQIFYVLSKEREKTKKKKKFSFFYTHLKQKNSMKLLIYRK